MRGTKESVEEARFKLSLMSLTDAAISFCDDFRSWNCRESA